MVCRLLLLLLLWASAARAGEVALTPEEVNAAIACLRAKMEAATTPETKRKAWSELVTVVNGSSDFSRYFSAKTPGSVNLNEPFAVHVQDADAGANARNPYGMPVNLLVFRGDPGALRLDEIPIQQRTGSYITRDALRGESLTREQIAEKKSLSLKSLYDEFEDQPGRAENIGKYSAQDAKPIATHFVLIIEGQPVARIQVQVSTDHAVELNYEENFANAPRPEAPGERRAEIGRNGLVRAENRSPEVRKIIDENGGDEHLRDLLFQKAFSWINSDAALERVRFHVNGAVRRNWSRSFRPLRFDQEVKLQDDPSPAKVEWLLTFERKSLLRLEEGMLAKCLLDQVVKIRKDPSAYPESRKPQHLIELFFRGNEMAAVERLGLLKLGHAWSFHEGVTSALDIPREKLPELEAALRAKLLQPAK